MNIIADIAGHYDELIKLMDIMPNDGFIFLGDMVDRGPQGRQVLEFVKNNPEITALYGNHEDLMVDWVLDYKQYPGKIWAQNGGDTTLKSYENGQTRDFDLMVKHSNWLETLPLYHKGTYDGMTIFCSHAPWYAGMTLEEVCDVQFNRTQSLLWNRSKVLQDIPNTTQFFGHNSHWGVTKFKRPDGSLSAICLDGSDSNVLTGYSTKTREIHQVPYNKAL